MHPMQVQGAVHKNLPDCMRQVKFRLGKYFLEDHRKLMCEGQAEKYEGELAGGLMLLMQNIAQVVILCHLRAFFCVIGKLYGKQ